MRASSALPTTPPRYPPDENVTIPTVLLCSDIPLIRAPGASPRKIPAQFPRLGNPRGQSKSTTLPLLMWASAPLTRIPASKAPPVKSSRVIVNPARLKWTPSPVMVGYETSFREDDGNATPWPIPNVFGVKRRASSAE